MLITVLNILLGVREERLKKAEMSKKIGRFLTRCQGKKKNLVICGYVALGNGRREVIWGKGGGPDILTTFWRTF